MSARPSPSGDPLGDVVLPLGRDESRRAIDAVVARLGPKRLRVYGAELRIDKQARRGSRLPRPQRRITVLVADMDDFLPYEAVVDAKGAVTEVRERPELILPFSGREVEAAIALARAHPDLADIVDRQGVDAAAFYPTPLEFVAPSPRHRRVGVHFLDFSDPATVTPLASAVVDLSAGQVESIARHDRAT